uniref:Uncharacterized protein n=1 Tax=Anguilla anguilla TaxID=7936 RepID=A0A0E9WX52_ANGAN
MFSAPGEHLFEVEATHLHNVDREDVPGRRLLLQLNYSLLAGKYTTLLHRKMPHT